MLQRELRVGVRSSGMATKFDARVRRYVDFTCAYATNELPKVLRSLKDTVQFFVQGIPNALKVGKTLQKFHTLFWLVGIV